MRVTGAGRDSIHEVVKERKRTKTNHVEKSILRTQVHLLRTAWESLGKTEVVENITKK